LFHPNRRPSLMVARFWLAGVLGFGVLAGNGFFVRCCRAAAKVDSGKTSTLPHEDVAVVNGQVITRKELAGILIELFGDQALDILIKRTLVEQAARKKGLTVSQAEMDEAMKPEVDKQIQGFMQAFGFRDLDQLKAFLRPRGLTLQEFRARARRTLRGRVRTRLLLGKILRAETVVTEDEIKKEYSDKYGSKVIARQIVVVTREKAREILSKLKAGADFAAIARSDSIDRASAHKGGLMAPLPAGSDFARKLADVEPGGLSNIIRTDFGYHILKVVRRETPARPAYTSVHEKLRQEILDRKVKDGFENWLASAIENAKIEKNL